MTSGSGSLTPVTPDPATGYASYTYYTGIYLGNTISSVDFARISLRASEIIDQLTYNRAAAYITADTPAATVTAIKMATCAVADEYYLQELDGNGGGIQSERLGNHSITYNSASNKVLSSNKKFANIASRYLASTGLMYAGFYSDEYGSLVNGI